MQIGNLAAAEHVKKLQYPLLGKVSFLLYHVRRYEVPLVRLTVPVAIGRGRDVRRP